MALAFVAFFVEAFTDDLALPPGRLLVEARVEDLVPWGWYSGSEDEATGVVGGGLDLERTRFVDSEGPPELVKNGQGPLLA